MEVDLKIKNNQLSLPFGQVRLMPNKQQAKSPIKLSELKEHGLAQVTPLAAEVILELSKHYSDESDFRFGVIQSPDDIHSTFRSELNSYAETIFMLAALNVKHFITITKMLSGLPTVRQTMRWAISHSAGGVILCRNNLDLKSFTTEEKDFLAEIKDADSIIGIDLLDYVLIGKTGYRSARSEGLI